MSSGYTIWIDVQKNKYFKVPDDAQVPRGGTTLYTLGGRRTQVDVGAMSAWEITAAEAQVHLQVDLFQLFAGPDKWRKEPSSVEEGEAPVQLSTQEVSDLFGDLADALADSISGDEERLKRARTRARAFMTRAEALDAEVDPVVETLPDLLQAAYAGSENKAGFHRMEKLLRGLSEELEQLQAGDMEGFLQSLARLNQLIGDLFRREETEEERMERYREMARQAMPEIPRPDITKMVADYRAGLTTEES